MRTKSTLKVVKFLEILLSNSATVTNRSSWKYVTDFGGCSAKNGATLILNGSLSRDAERPLIAITTALVANFGTPPDGQRPTMNMFKWTRSSPNRDGSLDNAIVFHEYGHGISNRLTGDADQANCLGNLEARGMGEGWSDAFAMYLGRPATDTRNDDFVIGAYAANRPQGIRSFPYSTSLKRNPLTYKDLNARNEGTFFLTSSLHGRSLGQCFE